MTDMMTDMRGDNEEQPKDWFNNLDWSAIFQARDNIFLNNENIKNNIFLDEKFGLPIKINYHGLPYRLKQIEGSDWIDLYVVESYHLKAGEREYLNLGISMKLPEGYEAYIVPRSSTFKKYGILQTNSPAVIDNAYNGDDDIWKYPVYATREIWIPEGARICQFRIQKSQPKVEFIEVDSLGEENRGGLGSTGDGVL